MSQKAYVKGMSSAAQGEVLDKSQMGKAKSLSNSSCCPFGMPQCSHSSILFAILACSQNWAALCLYPVQVSTQFLIGLPFISSYTLFNEVFNTKTDCTIYSQAGEARTMIGTLDGLRQSIFTSSSLLLQEKPNHSTITRSGEIMKELLRAGGKAEVRIGPQILYSDAFMKSLCLADFTSTPTMSPAPTTQQTPSLEATSVHPISASPGFPSLTSWHNSSPTTTLPLQQPNSASMALLESLLMQLNLSGKLIDNPMNSGSWKKKADCSLPFRRPGSCPTTLEYPATTPIPTRTYNVASSH
ncbi:hypothetical protein GYMLUDRAFT_58019 [Collybiopsis luxurians FD-317 M1]|uniref:Uncharacterized protein n=1 Tax=Collybiopsis luxurians FD-317 M1 TaxID=944289 RepID=A0A0D0CJ29_9AGAR|nr:hypothetical protein GYMLUDRAFT_58019 [Collybiopsis luxurians FD-317 M1]